MVQMAGYETGFVTIIGTQSVKLDHSGLVDRVSSLRIDREEFLFPSSKLHEYFMVLYLRDNCGLPLYSGSIENDHGCEVWFLYTTLR